MKKMLPTKIRRIACLCALLFLTNNLRSQQTYYVAANGSDTNAGTSSLTAWKTLAKVNSTVLVNGDNILLRRGDTFPGTLRVKYSGVTVDAFGSGDKPLISGQEKITSAWTVYSGSIWQTTFATGKPTDIRGLYNNGIALPVSRFPNKNVNNGYLNFETHTGTTQFSDAQLTGSPSWTGAEVVVRAERFRLVKTKVNTHSGGTITFPSSASITQLWDTYGYFFVNHINAIDQSGEWAYQFSSGKLFLYSASNPGSGLSFARTDTTLLIENANNVTIRNIQLKYARLVTLSVKTGSSILIDHVDIARSGAEGVVFSAVTNSTFSNNTIDEANWSGFNSLATCDNISITGNKITNSGNEAYGKSKTFIGIDCNSPNCRIEDNVISKTGYSGIISAGRNNLVKHNIIDSICLYLEDNGGIYTNGNIGNTDSTLIEENIVTNSVGERMGAPAPTSKANGIYVDNYSLGVTLKNNTVAHVNGAGIFAGSMQTGVKILDNTSFNSGDNELQLYHPLTAPGLLISGNLLVAKSDSASHEVFRTVSTDEYSYAELGQFTNNYFINPFRDTAINFNYRGDNGPRTQRYTPYEWEAFTAQVTGTSPAVKNYTSGTLPDDVIKFYCNNTGMSQTYTLPSGLFISAKNQAYCGSFSLPAYHSAVLFKVDTGTCITPGSCGVPDSLKIGTVTDTTSVLRWLAAGNINNDVRYRPAGDSSWKYANNIQNDSVLLIGLTSSTDYECAVRSSCYGSESDWISYDGFTTLPGAPKPYSFKFVNATYANCSPGAAFANPELTNDSLWTLVNSSGTGTVDKDFMRSNAGTENSPPITMTVDSVLDKCNTYDVYLYYLSPTTQPWKTRARLSDSSTFIIFDRATAGAELLPDYSGTTASNRLFRAKLGRVSGVTGFSLVLDDMYFGASSKSVFDGVGYIQVSDEHPAAPGLLDTVSASGGNVVLQWQDLSGNETSYIVQRKSGPTPFTVIATLPAGTVSYTDSSVANGTYIYRVACFADSCRSAYSNQLSVQVNNPAPGARMVKQKDLPATVTVSAGKAPSAAFMNVHPNPSDGVFFMETSSLPAARYRIKVLAINGRVVINADLNPDEKFPYMLNLAAQPRGIYIVELTNRKSGDVFYKRIIRN